MPAPISPAAKRLADLNVKAYDVAAVANVTPAAISRWLAGKRPYQPSFPSALSELLEPGQVTQILAVIPVKET